MLGEWLRFHETPAPTLKLRQGEIIPFMLSLHNASSIWWTCLMSYGRTLPCNVVTVLFISVELVLYEYLNILLR